MNISIHALVKRATLNNLAVNLMRPISIHALVKRATDALDKEIDDYQFQSTPS